MPKFHIRFGEGAEAKTIVMSPIGSIRRRNLHHLDWGKDESIRKFLWYLSRSDSEGLEAATSASIRLNCLSDALKNCLIGPKPNLGKLKMLLHLWNNRGLWAIPRALREDLYLVTDAIRYFAPPYDGDKLTLYRGQSRERYERGVCGIAWTSRYEVAEQFSKIRDVPGIVLRVDASPDIIVTRVADHISTPKTDPQNRYEYEDEYLLDPRKLVGMVTAVDHHTSHP